MSKRRAVSALLLVLILWIALFCTDYYRVTRFEKPVFCVLTQGYDDGGSGCYRGLGYSFAIEGNFMPEDEYPGVTHYHVKLFGIHLKSGIRD